MRLEDQLQRDTATLLKALGWLAWHTPNGEARDSATGGKLKRMGTLRGVSDWIIAEHWEKDGRSGFLVAVELKAPKGVVSATQKAFLADMALRGVLVEVCRSMDEFLRVCRCVRPLNGRGMR